MSVAQQIVSMPAMALAFALLLLVVPVGANDARRDADKTTHRSIAQGETLTDRAAWYVELRDSLRGGAADPAVLRSPEQIEARRKTLVKAVRDALPDTGQGWLLPEADRRRIEAALQRLMAQPAGGDLADTVLGEGNPVDEGEGFELEALGAYPDDAPRSAMPPGIISELPALPETLQYRFVGRHLLIHDVVTELVLDFYAHAVPASKP